MKTVWLAIITAVNLLSFLACAMDKRRAIRGKWRIRERTLWLLTICFGSLGMFLGMRLFHHKTQKTAFRIGVPIVLVVQLFVLIRYVL